MKNLQVRTYSDLATEPVTLAEAKLFLKVTGTEEDSLITDLITSARRMLEKYTSSSFGTKTLHATWVEPTADDLYELPYGPHRSVDHVYRIDAEGTETAQTVNVDYWIRGDQDFYITIGKKWSTGYPVSTDSLRVEYTAGYGGTTTEALPDELKVAILKQVATDYELRENISLSGGTVLSNESKTLANPYRRKLWL